MIRLFQRNDKPRTLLLERLERRCMLNAHFDCSPMDQDDRIGDSIRAHERPAHLRNGSGALSQATQPEGQGPRGQHRGQPTHTVPVISVPTTPARTVSSTSVVVVFRPSNSNPIPVVPVTSPSVSNTVVNTIGSSASATSPALPQEQQAETEADSRELSSDAAKLQQQQLVSFRTVESQNDDESRLTDRSGNLSTIVDRQIPQAENQFESLDRWLAEFSQTSNQFSDLDSTLDDLALSEQMRANRKFSLPQSIEPDRRWRIPSVEIQADLESSSDDMIWLAPFTQTASSGETRGVDSTDDVFAQSTTGIGWYQQFEFVDQADIDAMIENMSPVMAAAASTSDLVIDAVQPTSNERVQILSNRSVSYAVVAAGVASWQVIQRRKRRDN